nr:hypothetical protein SHINE37_100356 [Rhizobiaceae bacterium]
MPGDKVSAHLDLSLRGALVHLRPAGALRHRPVQLGGCEQHFDILRRSTGDQAVPPGHMTVDLLDADLFFLCFPHRLATPQNWRSAPVTPCIRKENHEKKRLTSDLLKARERISPLVGPLRRSIVTQFFGLFGQLPSSEPST